MYPHDKDGLFRAVSLKLLFKPFQRSGLSANQITVGNFLIPGLGSIVLFAVGYEIAALGLLIIMAMVDYVDGAISRSRGSEGNLGAYLDTSLDWLYLMMLVGAISYHNQIMPLGYIALIAISYGNWVEYNGPAKFTLPLPFNIGVIILCSVLLGCSRAGIALITATQITRTIILYGGSVWNKSKDVQ